MKLISSFFRPPVRRWRSGGATEVVSYVRKAAEELTGQTEVAVAQREVREKREELKRWRQKVAEAAALHEDTQHRLRHVYALKTQLYQAQRRDLAALQAANSEEESLLSREQSEGETLESLKTSERECFDALGDAILASHEKERAQSERMKYYSRLGSVLGAVIGFAGSNLFLRREVRHYHRLQLENMERAELALQELALQSASGDSDVSEDAVREVMVSESQRQMKVLEEIRKEVSHLSTTKDMCDPPIIVGTGVSLFVCSFALSAAVFALNSR